MKKPFILIIARVLAGLTIAGPLLAAPSHVARREAAERFDRAIRRVEGGDLTGALAEFQRTYALIPSVVVLYNLGLVQAELGRSVDAVRSLTRVTAAPESLTAEELARAQQALREQQERIGRVELVANVKSGAVELDNIEVAKLPLAAPIDVAVGSHVLAVVSPGYAPQRREIVVASRQLQNVEFNLVAIEGLFAHIALSCPIPDADVFVDGERVGRTPLDSNVTVAPGAHFVEVRRAGYATVGRQLSLGEGAHGQLLMTPPIDPEAQTREGGYLSIQASESHGVASVDGKSLGPVTGPIALPRGRHRLRVERGGFLPAERDIEVPLGGTRTVEVEFEPTPETRAEHADRSYRWRNWSFVTMGLGVAAAATGTTIALLQQNQLPGANEQFAQVQSDWEKGAGGACDASLELSAGQKQACRSRWDETSSRIDNLKLVRSLGWATAGVGAGVLATGVVLWLVGDDPHKYDQKQVDSRLISWRWAPTVTGSTAGFAVTGEF